MDFGSGEDPKLDFKEVDCKYAQLKGLHEAGTFTDKEFDEQLKRWMVQDQRGRWWAKSRESGEWHYHDGSSWVKSIPPGLQSTPTERLPMEGGVSDCQQSLEQQEAWWRQKEVLSNLAVSLAGATWLVVGLARYLFSAGNGSTSLVLGALGALVGTLVGLWGLLMQQAASYRRLAKISLILASISTTSLFIALVLTSSAQTLSAGVFIALISLLGMFLGFTLTGVAYVQARVLSHWENGVLIALLIGSVLFSFFPRVTGAVGACILGCMWLALGYAIWSRRRAATPSGNSARPSELLGINNTGSAAPRITLLGYSVYKPLDRGYEVYLPGRWSQPPPSL